MQHRDLKWGGSGTLTSEGTGNLNHAASSIRHSLCCAWLSPSSSCNVLAAPATADCCVSHWPHTITPCLLQQRQLMMQSQCCWPLSFLICCTSSSRYVGHEMAEPSHAYLLSQFSSDELAGLLQRAPADYPQCMVLDGPLLTPHCSHPACLLQEHQLTTQCLGSLTATGARWQPPGPPNTCCSSCSSTWAR